MSEIYRIRKPSTKSIFSLNSWCRKSMISKINIYKRLTRIHLWSGTAIKKILFIIETGLFTLNPQLPPHLIRVRNASAFIHWNSLNRISTSILIGFQIEKCIQCYLPHFKCWTIVVIDSYAPAYCPNRMTNSIEIKNNKIIHPYPSIQINHNHNNNRNHWRV